MTVYTVLFLRRRPRHCLFYIGPPTRKRRVYSPDPSRPNRTIDQPNERTKKKTIIRPRNQRTGCAVGICGRAGSGCFSLQGGGHENVADLRRVSVRAGEKNLTHWSFTATHFSPRNREERVDGVPVPRPYISPYCMRSGCRRPEA